MIVLGIETSCDETSVAVLDGEGRVLSNVVSSQMQAHALYGGVVPEVAARAHLENLPAALEGALETAGARLEDVGLVAATAGPGLIGALLVGLSAGKALAFARGLPLVPVNHLEGHLFSAYLRPAGEAPTRSRIPFTASSSREGTPSSCASRTERSSPWPAPATTRPEKPSTRSRGARVWGIPADRSSTASPPGATGAAFPSRSDGAATGRATSLSPG